MNTFWDKLGDWLVGVAAIALTGVFSLLWRWVSMLHKHEQQIALLQQGQAQQTATNDQVLKAVSEVRETQEAHRREALERLEGFRTDLKSDLDRLISIIRK